MLIAGFLLTHVFIVLPNLYLTNKLQEYPNYIIYSNAINLIVGVCLIVLLFGLIMYQIIKGDDRFDSDLATVLSLCFNCIMTFASSFFNMIVSNLLCSNGNAQYLIISNVVNGLSCALLILIKTYICFCLDSPKPYYERIPDIKIHNII